MPCSLRLRKTMPAQRFVGPHCSRSASVCHSAIRFGTQSLTLLGPIPPSQCAIAPYRCCAMTLLIDPKPKTHCNGLQNTILSTHFAELLEIRSLRCVQGNPPGEILQQFGKRRRIQALVGTSPPVTGEVKRLRGQESADLRGDAGHLFTRRKSFLAVVDRNQFGGSEAATTGKRNDGSEAPTIPA
jgi:hypothetical protein